MHNTQFHLIQPFPEYGRKGRKKGVLDSLFITSEVIFKYYVAFSYEVPGPEWFPQLSLQLLVFFF